VLQSLSHILQEILLFDTASPFPSHRTFQFPPGQFGSQSPFNRLSLVGWKVNTLLRDRDLWLYYLAREAHLFFQLALLLCYPAADLFRFCWSESAWRIMAMRNLKRLDRNKEPTKMGIGYAYRIHPQRHRQLHHYPFSHLDISITIQDTRVPPALLDHHGFSGN
jgi:hypothetical protein